MAELVSETPAERHRWIAVGFTDRVRGTTDWDAQSPVPEWRARDVVRHLVEWFPGFLHGGSGIELPRGPSPDVDPLAAWVVQVGAVQAVLDDTAASARTFADPRIGELPVAQAIDRFYTVDVFMHTWDLARATGQDEQLEPALCQQLYEGMLPMDEILRTSGHYGPRVHVPDDADPQTQLLAFIGRDPLRQ
jgi:uncharacterized protein (TIGR03086 family)